jgi:hypothetical protein
LLLLSFIDAEVHMDSTVRAFVWLIISLVPFALAACSPGGGAGGGGTGGSRAEDEAYSGGYDEEDLLAFVQDEGFPDLRFPKNQLIIKAAEATTRDQFLALLDQVGGTLIGEIPPLRSYQVQVNTTSKEELRQLYDSLETRGEVEEVTYNFILTPAGSPDFLTCPVMPDNKNMYPADADPMDALSDYYTALEIVSGMRDSISMSDVTIGLVEFGFQNAGGQFDETTIQYVLGEGGGVTNDNHGNAVTGLVCADNDGGGINGIASSFLWDKLVVAFARPRGLDIFSYAVAMAAVSASADIVLNAHFAMLGPTRERFSPIFVRARNLMTDAIANSPGVLFINAAPNVNTRLTEENAFPAGIRRDNTVTVGATSSESASRASSAYGALVDISAPGEGIFVLEGDGTLRLVGPSENATSIAAPQVASAAALLKSVDRNLSNREVKSYLLEYVGGEGFSGPVAVSGEGGVLLNYARSLMDLLWDRYQDREWAFIMDNDENGVADGPSLLAQNLCGDFNLKVEGVGEFDVVPTADCFGQEQVFFLYANGSSMAVTLGGYDEDNYRWGMFTITTEVPIPGLFEVDTPYDIGDSADEVFAVFSAVTDRDGDCRPELGQAGDIFANASPVTGTFELTNCRVFERTADGEAKYLLVDIAINCVLDVYIQKFPDEFEEFAASAQGWIRSVVVYPLPPLATFDTYIDEMCSGQVP